MPNKQQGVFSTNSHKLQMLNLTYFKINQHKQIKLLIIYLLVINKQQQQINNNQIQDYLGEHQQLLISPPQVSL